MTSASLVIEIPPVNSQDDIALSMPHSPGNDASEPALRDVDLAPNVISSTLTFPENDSHAPSEGQGHPPAEPDASPNTERGPAAKGQMFWDVGEILEKRRMDYTLDLLDRTTHSVCTATDGPVEECMVCLEDMADGQIVSTLPCKHTFHHECIAAWLRAKLHSGAPGRCPNCNFQIVVPIVAPSPPAAAGPGISVLYVPGPDDIVRCCGMDMRRSARLAVVSVVLSIIVISTLTLAYFSKPA